ncbi:alanine:cation symporter family protein [Gammaproteobacteria bacterium]|nr:alanine:cation symporter family protein [Gammaproteobacteria bacterium]
MEAFMALLNTLSSFIWGPFTLVLLLGVGIYLSLGLKLLPWRRIPYAFRQLMASRKATSDGDGDGEISPFNALMTAMSATVGTGNIRNT